MPLPLNGLSIEELEHYSGIEPGASEELARRIAEGRAAEQRKMEQIQDELDNAERQLSDAEDNLSCAEDSLADITNVCRLAKEALEDFLPLLPEHSSEKESAADLIKTLEKLA